MAEVTYYFNAKGTDVWSAAAYIIDNILTNYAYTTSDVIQLVNGNNCPGTNLGTITKVELRVYAYGDGNDRIDLTPVFSGGDGDKHQTTPGVSAGWGVYQDITEDTNSPPEYEKNVEGSSEISFYNDTWKGQTFTIGTEHSIDFVSIKCYKTGSPGNITIGIRATDGSGHPTGNDLSVGTIQEADIPISSGWIECSMSSYSLLQGTKYAIVCRVPTGDSSNKVTWIRNVGDVYAAGNYEHSSNAGGDWTEATNYDFTFKEGVWWVFGNIQTLDCKVEKENVSKANVMFCAKVEIKVTYTPPGEGVTRSYGFIFG